MRNNEGSALLIVIITFAVLMTLGTVMLATSFSETKQVANQEERNQAHYTARSGAEAMASLLAYSNVATVTSYINGTSLGPATGQIGGQTFEVVVSGTPTTPIISSKVYKMENGFKVMIGSMRIAMKPKTSNLLNYSVFSDLSPEIGKNHSGNVGTNGNDVDIANHVFKIDGNVTIVGTAAEAAALQSSIVQSGHTVTALPGPTPIPPIDESQFPRTTDTLAQGNLPSGTQEILNDGTVKKYRVPSISLGGNDTFEVSGGGVVHLYVTGPISLSGNSDIECQSGTKLVIYSNQTAINFQGTPSLNCVLYAPRAAVSIGGGGSGTFDGQIICKDFDAGNSAASGFISGMSVDDLLVTPTPAGFERDIYGK